MIYDNIKSHKKIGLHRFSEKNIFLENWPPAFGNENSVNNKERESEQQNRNRKQWKIRIRNLEIGFVEFRLTVNTQVNFEWKMLFTVSRE